MPIIKYIERLQRMDNLIRRKATGSPEVFASKMGIDRSTLMRYLAELRKLDAPIHFDSTRQSYYYEEEVSFEFGFRKLSENDLLQKTGGANYILSLTI